MYEVLDISRYVINYSNKMDYGVSNLKLQKLLYFIQASFLMEAIDAEACFKEKIEAWNFGPVVPVAYHEFKQYGSADIPPVKSYLTFSSGKPWDYERLVFDDSIIKERDKKIINEVIDDLSDFSAAELVSITHNQAPWKDAYEPFMNNEITVDAIRKYFNEQ